MSPNPWGEDPPNYLYLSLFKSTMLNRRILRVKAFQNLYAYEQCKGSNLNLAKDYIRESFLPDLNSMEVQDKAALSREAEEAIAIFEQNVEKNQKLIAVDASEKVKKIALAAVKQVQEANEKDRLFLLKNMVVSAERIPQLYLLAIELLQAFAKHVGKEVAKKQKLAGDNVVVGNELNLVNNQVLKRLRESTEYQAALTKNGVHLEDLELEIKEWFREYIKPAEAYQQYLSLPQPQLNQDFEVVDELLKKIIFKNEVILTFFAEKDLNWTENKSVVRSLAAKVLKNAALGEEKPWEPLP